MAKENSNGANLGFESEIWRAADALRIYWVPQKARWSKLKSEAKRPTIGKVIDDAMLAIERDNPSLKGVLPKDYAHTRLDKQRLGQLFDMVGNIGMGDKANHNSDWRGEMHKDDKRWKFATPPAGNAHFVWVQHFIHHLAPNGPAGFVLANGSMSSNQSGEGEIRKNIIEADLVDCMVAMPGQFFYSTQIPICLGFIARDKWELLRNRKFMNLKFRRQHQFREYFADFYCDEHKLIIELDGGVHADERQAKKVKARDAYMNSLGLTVVRFPNSDVLNKPESVLQQIASFLPSPTWRGVGGEGVAVYRDIPGFYRAPRSMISAITTTFSRPDATSARPRLKTTCLRRVPLAFLYIRYGVTMTVSTSDTPMTWRDSVASTNRDEVPIGSKHTSRCA